MTIGFIGLGKMGAAMAQHLVEAGYSVIGHDIVKPPALPAELVFASDLASVANCKIVITMLPDGDIVEGVIKTLCTMGCKAKFIDMSSSHPDVSLRLYLALKADNISFIDAPVSGGVGRAQNACLQIMAGGDAKEVAQLEPTLSSMGSVIYLGPAGCGHAMKALNNYVSAAGLIASFEALAVARDLGIAPERFLEVINSSTGRNNTTESKIERYVSSETFDSGFALKLMAKDVAIASSISAASGANGPVTAAVRQFLETGLASLGDEADHTELYLKVANHQVGL